MPPWAEELNRRQRRIIKETLVSVWCPLEESTRKTKENLVD